jgi:hypothetical protein
MDESEEEYRNREMSRKIILGRLKIYGQKGVTAAVILKRALNSGGPWSEDLRDLINEGLVESHDPNEKLSMQSMVRLAGLV